MKNIILTIVLCLFAVGCDDFPLFPTGGDCDIEPGCETWKCLDDNSTYGDEDHCNDSCDTECVEVEG